MSDIRKFYADVQRCLKHERSDFPGGYNGLHAAKYVEKIFVSYNADLGSLPVSIAELWESRYITVSADSDTEPTTAHIDWLAAILSFMDGELLDDIEIPMQDWKDIAELISCEAEDLPIDVLTSMMTILVEKSVL